jgi:hypothetical protein
LLDLPPAPPGGSPSTSPTLVVTAVGPAANTPQEARHQCLQLRWWPLLDLPPAPPRGFAIDVSNSTIASTAVAPVTAAAPEGEDLDITGSKRIKKGKKGERAGQTEVSKHPCRDIWPVGWSHMEPQTSWPRPLTMPGRGPVSPRLLPRPPPQRSPPQPSSSWPPPQLTSPRPPCQLWPPHRAPPAQRRRVAVAASAEARPHRTIPHHHQG